MIIYYHHPKNNPTICHSFTLWLPGSFKNALNYLRQSPILKDKLILLPGYPDQVMQCCISGKVRANSRTKELYPRKSATLELAEEVGFNILPKDLSQQMILKEMPFVKHGITRHHQVFYYSLLLENEKINDDMNPLFEFRKTTEDSYENRVCVFVGIDEKDIDLIKERKRMNCNTDRGGETLICMPYQMLIEILESHENEICQIVDIKLPKHKFEKI